MIVAFDNTILSLLLHPEADPPLDAATGALIARAQDRIAYLVEQLRESGARILIPAPVLAEFLTFAGPDYLAVINQSAHFEIAPFDQRAAVEAAAVQKKANASTRGKKSGLTGKWQTIKVDRQIVAIAKVRNAERIYTTDGDVAELARESGITAVGLADLPLPPEEETQLPFDGEQ